MKTQNLQPLIFTVFFVFSALLVNAQTAEELSTLLGQRKYEEVVEKGKIALKDSPDDGEINFIVGKALAEGGEYKEAMAYLEKGLKDEKNWVRAWSQGYLGLCYYGADQYQTSRDFFNQSIELNATENATKFAVSLQKAFQMGPFYDSWEIKETPRFRFHFQDISRIESPEIFMEDREKAYKELNKFFNARPIKKIDFFVWESNEDAKKELGRDLGFAESKVCIINSLPQQTRGHEIAHILSDFGIKPERKPTLINEGLAVFFDFSSRNKLELAKMTLNGVDIKLLDLWKDEKSFPSDYYYAVGGAWIEFLWKKGSKEQLKKFLKHQTPEAAKEIYPNFDDLIVEFESSLKS